jgi:ABC-2 type transport system ATP-binding protein
MSNLAPSAAAPAASLSRVVKRYGEKVALDGVSLAIQPGQVTALLGPNGAGKTTAISLLLGLARADAGEVRVLGGPPHELAVRRRLGVMLQSAALPDTLRVGELLRLVCGYYPRPRPLDDVAALAGLTPLLRVPYAKLSGGQQRRVQFALAICGNPELVFLDEPTTGLDIEAREALWGVVRELTARGAAVLLTTHYLEEAEALAQRVAVLVRGRIVSEGTVDEIRAHGVCRRIRCISELPVEEIRGWAGVSGASREARWLEIEGAVAEPIVRRLLAADPHLSELEVRRSGLAEAFVRITREAA